MLDHNPDPIERKVQLTGGSTYTVSLPKDWAGEQDIEPGSSVDLYSQEDRLVVTRSGSELDGDREVTTVSAGDRDPSELSLAVASAYMAGCEELLVEDIRDAGQRRAVTRTIRRFVGLEVMTEDADSLFARTMLDVGELSPEQTVLQIQRTTLAMHREAIDAVVSADGETGGTVAQQDDDVDRLFALVSRGCQQSLVDPAITIGDGDVTAFEYRVAARQLERIADHAEKIGTTAGRLEHRPPDEVAERLLEFGDRARTVVREATNGLLDGSTELGDVVGDAEPLLADIESFDQALYERGLEDGYLLGLVLDSVGRTVHYGVNVAEAGLQARYRS